MDDFCLFAFFIAIFAGCSLLFALKKNEALRQENNTLRELNIILSERLSEREKMQAAFQVEAQKVELQIQWMKQKGEEMELRMQLFFLELEKKSNSKF